jgi:hypothetical protein
VYFEIIGKIGEIETIAIGGNIRIGRKKMKIKRFLD